MTTENESIAHKTVDFFTSNKEGYVSSGIIKFNFIKLGLTAMLISGLSFTGGLIIQSNILTDNIIVNSVKEMNDNSADINFVKSIKQEDWQNFNRYLDQQKHLYDAKVNYVSINVSNAYYSWVVREKQSTNTVLGMNYSLDLKNNLSSYHEDMDEKIVNINNSYRQLINGKRVSSSNLAELISTYDLFIQKKFINNNDIDEAINAITFTYYAGNTRYFQKHNVYNKINEFDNNMKFKR